MATRRRAAADKAADNLATFNQEAFETAVEMQMNFLETASRFAREFTSFAVHRAEANAKDFARLTDVKSPPDLMRLQLDRMRTMFEDYSKEANRLAGLAGETVKESSEAVRSTYLGKDELRKAG